MMSRRDIGTGRDTLVLPLGPLTGPQRGVLCFQLEYRWLQHPVTPPCSAFPCLLKSVLKPLHWEPCFPLSTLIWLHRPPTRFASSADGRGEELNSPLSSCSRSLTNAPLAHTHTRAPRLPPCSNSHQKNSNLRLLTAPPVKHKKTTTLKAGFVPLLLSEMLTPQTAGTGLVHYFAVLHLPA